MKKSAFILLLVISFLIIAGCKKDKGYNEGNIIKDYDKNEKLEASVTPQPTAVPTEEPDDNIDEADSHEGEIRSFLSGLWVPEDIGTKRPLAIQFSDFKTVKNQWGIGQADIVYEALVEGGITRLLGIGENFSGDRFGSVRSSRHYFASFADEYDAIYVHYGKTKYAVTKLKELGIDNLDGETGIGTTVFYRDKTMKAPHNAFASIEGINKGIQKKGFDTEYSEGYKPHFMFYEEDTELTGQNASRLEVKFSGYNSPYFEYNNSDKLYYRYQFDEVHKDSNTGEQLAFKNIIVWFVKEWDIDKNDYQTMELEDAQGKGYYITNGKMFEITWKKNEDSSWMRFYDNSGMELTINPGKTYIAVFPVNRTKDIVIK